MEREHTKEKQIQGENQTNDIEKKCIQKQNEARSVIQQLRKLISFLDELV